MRLSIDVDLNPQEEYDYLRGLGYTGTINDMRFAFLSALGFTGSVNDKMSSYLESGAIQTLMSAVASTWDGTQMVTDLGSFTVPSGATAPTLSENKLIFDGVGDKLTLATPIDLEGKTVVAVFKPLSTPTIAAQDSVACFFASGSKYAQLEARSSNLWEQRHRHAGTGISGSQMDAVTLGNARVDVTDTDTITVAMYESGRAVLTSSNSASVSLDITSPTLDMTEIRIGHNRTDAPTAMEFYALYIIDSVDPANIRPVISHAETTFSITGPNVTQFLEDDVFAFGDSITVGVGDSVENGFMDRTAQEILADNLDRTSGALASAQMSPYGLTSPADDAIIAACASNITGTASYSGASLLTLSYGTNDFGNGETPIGVITDVDPLTFYGAANIALNNMVLENPTSQIVITTPTHRTGETTPNAAGRTLEDYRSALRALGLRHNITVVEMGTLWNDLTNAVYTTDGLHPNATGHQLMADQLVAALEGTLLTPSIVVPVPVAAGGLADLTLTDSVTMTPVDVSTDFTGLNLTFALAPTSAALPAGLSLSSSGVISGTPTATVASANIIIRATNASGFADSAFGLTVQSVGGTIAETADWGDDTLAGEGDWRPQLANGAVEDIASINSSTGMGSHTPVLSSGALVFSGADGAPDTGVINLTGASGRVYEVTIATEANRRDIGKAADAARDVNVGQNVGIKFMIRQNAQLPSYNRTWLSCNSSAATLLTNANPIIMEGEGAHIDGEYHIEGWAGFPSNGMVFQYLRHSDDVTHGSFLTLEGQRDARNITVRGCTGRHVYDVDGPDYDWSGGFDTTGLPKAYFVYSTNPQIRDLHIYDNDIQGYYTAFELAYGNSLFMFGNTTILPYFDYQKTSLQSDYGRRIDAFNFKGTPQFSAAFHDGTSSGPHLDADQMTGGGGLVRVETDITATIIWHINGESFQGMLHSDRATSKAGGFRENLIGLMYVSDSPHNMSFGYPDWLCVEKSVFLPSPTRALPWNTQPNNTLNRPLFGSNKSGDGGNVGTQRFTNVAMLPPATVDVTDVDIATDVSQTNYLDLSTYTDADFNAALKNWGTLASIPATNPTYAEVMELFDPIASGTMDGISPYPDITLATPRSASTVSESLRPTPVLSNLVITDSINMAFSVDSNINQNPAIWWAVFTSEVTDPTQIRTGYTTSEMATLEGFASYHQAGTIDVPAGATALTDGNTYWLCMVSHNGPNKQVVLTSQFTAGAVASGPVIDSMAVSEIDESATDPTFAGMAVTQASDDVYAIVAHRGLGNINGVTIGGTSATQVGSQLDASTGNIQNVTAWRITNPGNVATMDVTVDGGSGGADVEAAVYLLSISGGTASPRFTGSTVANGATSISHAATVAQDDLIIGINFAGFVGGLAGHAMTGLDDPLLTPINFIATDGTFATALGDHVVTSAEAADSSHTVSASWTSGANHNILGVLAIPSA